MVELHGNAKPSNYEGEEDVVTFGLATPLQLDPNGIAQAACVVLDSCGNIIFMSWPSAPRQESPRLSLQFSPVSEPYDAIYVDTSSSETKFILVVCSSGIYVVEVFAPCCVNRQMATSVPGVRMQAISWQNAQSVSILSQSPPSLLLLHHDCNDFQSMLLDLPSASAVLIDQCEIQHSLGMLWSTGTLRLCMLTSGKFRDILKTDHAPSAFCSLQKDETSHILAIGNEKGLVSIWNVKDESVRQVSSRQTHSSK